MLAASFNTVTLSGTDTCTEGCYGLAVTSAQTVADGYVCDRTTQLRQDAKNRRATGTFACQRTHATEQAAQEFCGSHAAALYGVASLTYGSLTFANCVLTVSIKAMGCATVATYQFVSDPAS